jgi:hypothetical protein
MPGLNDGLVLCRRIKVKDWPDNRALHPPSGAEYASVEMCDKAKVSDGNGKSRLVLDACLAS